MKLVIWIILKREAYCFYYTRRPESLVYVRLSEELSLLRMPYDQGNIDFSVLAQFLYFTKEALFSFLKHRLPALTSFLSIVGIHFH